LILIVDALSFESLRLNLVVLSLSFFPSLVWFRIAFRFACLLFRSFAADLLSAELTVPLAHRWIRSTSGVDRFPG
jgi:hypothetical protein